MRATLLSIFITISFSLKAQTGLFTKEVIGKDFEFKTPLDSFSDLYYIHHTENLFDSNYIEVNTQKIKLSSSPFLIIYHREIDNFLQLKEENVNKNLLVFFSFYDRKLISMEVYTKDSLMKNKIMQNIDRSFYYPLGKTYLRDDTLKNDFRDRVIVKRKVPIKGQNKTAKYFYRDDLETGFTNFRLSDIKADRFIPPWCGNDPRKGSWKKLKKYVNKK